MAVLACPRCPTAEVVRAAVFGEEFWSTLALLQLPLVVIVLVAALLYRGSPRRGGRSR